MNVKCLYSLILTFLVLDVYAQDFITLPGAENVEKNALSEAEYLNLIELSNGKGRNLLNATEVNIVVISGLYAHLFYERDLAKERFGLSDVQIDKLLERIDVARNVHRQVNTTNKNIMCRQWADSALTGHERAEEAMQNYNVATENSKDEVGDAYQTAISDFANIIGESEFIKIQDYVSSARFSVATSGQLFTLVDTIARSSNSDDYLHGICGGLHIRVN